MNEIKISVVIPVYNVEKYLKTCLESLTNQTLKDIEIICINDGSKDSSLDILKEFEKNDARIKIIDKENEGLSIARNIGIDLALGEYVSFVDSDDWVSKDYLESLYNAAKKYNSDIACSGIIRYSTSIRKKLVYKKEEYTNDPNEKMELTRVPIYSYVWNKIYRREKLLKFDLKFPEGRIFEDISWSIKTVYYLDGVVSVPKGVYYYRKNPKSVVSTKSEKNKNDCALSETEMLEFAKEKNLKLLCGYKFAKRDRVRFCGITLLKKFYYYPDIVEFCILGFIPIYRTKFVKPTL